MLEIGAQLYTVRELLQSEKEMESTLIQIKQIGYDSVQLYNLGSPEKIQLCCSLCEKSGLKISGILTDLDWCENNSLFLFDLCQKHNIKDIGVSSGVKDYESAIKYIPRANNFAKTVSENGYSFSYHNHGHEFIKTSCGKTVMELFIEGFSNYIYFMPDTYWIHDGGYDIRKFLEETAGRVEILHLKDLKRTESGHTYAEIGNGNLYFEEILKTAKSGGIKKYFVEQDICDGSPLDSLKISYNNILKILR